MNSKRMVGEHQGEHQIPPESLRIGRRCMLIPCDPEKWEEGCRLDDLDVEWLLRYDTTAQCIVVYLE